MDKKQKLLLENKSLFWDIKDFNNLSDLVIQERFLKYGNWKDIKTLIDIYGIEKIRTDYVIIKNKKRCDLSKKTINFFNLFLDV